MPTSTPTPGPVQLPTDCIVSVSPSEAFNAIGNPHTVYFLCGNESGLLPGPSSAPYPRTGCFDVMATVTDVTTGSASTFTSVQCASQYLTFDTLSLTPGHADCTSVSSPICPAGSSPSGPGGACAPCPVGFTFSSDENLCIMPSTGTCPPGTNPVKNSGGVIIECTEPPLDPTRPTSDNEMTLTINPGAPHDYRIDFTGFVGTTSGGACPAGTTLVSQVNVTPNGSTTSVYAPACRFNVSSEKKYLEGTELKIVPLGTCGEPTSFDILASIGGTPCFFYVEAFGTVVLKTGVSCSDGSEPANGSSATRAGFLPGSVYECSGDTLKVVHVPVPHISIDLTAINGFFGINCIPQARRPTATGTPAPASTGTPTLTPTSTPRPTSTPTPALPPGGTPIPGTTGSSGPAFCSPPGTSTTEVVTNDAGIAGFVGNEVEYNANAVPTFPPQQSNETIIGQFLLDGFGVGGIRMFNAFHFVEGTEFCDSSVTNGAGIATCVKYIDNLSIGSTVTVDVNFVLNCMEYDTTTAFQPVGSGTPTPTPNPTSTSPQLLTAPAPNGICILRSSPGQLAVSASFAPKINSQPALTTGPLILGNFGAATPVPTDTPTPIPPSSTPTPTATNTPIPTITNTPTATATSTATPGPSPTPIFTATATPIPTLKFSLDAARVTQDTKAVQAPGLDVVMPGERVQLRIYFTVRSLPRTLTRTTIYEIRRGNRTVFRVPFHSPQTPKEVGRFIRFIRIVIPDNYPFGVYEYRATLSFDGVSRHRVWKFAIEKKMRLAASLSDPSLKVSDGQQYRMMKS